MYNVCAFNIFSQLSISDSTNAFSQNFYNGSETKREVGTSVKVSYAAINNNNNNNNDNTALFTQQFPIYKVYLQEVEKEKMNIDPK